MMKNTNKGTDTLKDDVQEFWEAASCGENLYMKGEGLKEKFEHQSNLRYCLEPFILSFAEFNNWANKNVLEIGVGLGADHQMFAKNNAKLSGVDLTLRAVNYTKERLSLFGYSSNLQVGDAENLPFEDNSFDLVYSWGVIHHSPDTQKAVNEIRRVLKLGGQGKIMIYHKYSFVGYMLWVRYALLKGKPYLSLNNIYSKYLESPGTKAYSINEAKELFVEFSKGDFQTILGHGDLLTSAAGQRHEGLLLKIARKIWPRWIIRTFFKKHGLFLLINVTK